MFAVSVNQSVNGDRDASNVFHNKLFKWDINATDNSLIVSGDEKVFWLISMVFLITAVTSGLLALFLCRQKRMGTMKRRSQAIRQQNQELHHWKGKGDNALIGLGNDRPYGAYRTLMQ